MEIGVWMIVFAVVFDVIGVGSRQWANRVAAVLALGGFVRILAPSKAGGILRESGQKLAEAAGQAVGNFDPQWGRLVTSLGVAIAAMIVIIMWALMLAPSHHQLGPAASKEIDSRWIWGGALIAAIFAGAVPGPIGEGMVWVIGVGTDIGSSATGAAVAIGQIGGVAPWV